MPGIDSKKLRKTLIHNLIQSEEYANKVIPFIQKDYFSENYEKIIFEEIQRYYGKYNSLPSANILQIEVEARPGLTEAIYNEISSFLSEEMKSENRIDYLVKATEKWCRERATTNAVLKAAMVISNEDKKTTMGEAVEELKQAISLQFDSKVGHDYTEDAEARWEFYNNKEEKMPSGIAYLDEILRGGIAKKLLGVFLAGTGVGKSLMMCALATNYIKAGYNVLYITMEMAEEKIAQRIDQNVLDMTLAEIETVSKDMFVNRFNKIKSKNFGKLIVKEYPTRSAHIGHFRALLTELKQIKDFTPDIIFVDYLNICKSMWTGQGASTYEQAKSIAEELRSLAMEFNLPVITATQTNRTGYADADVDLTSTSESFGVPYTADFMFALTTTDTLKAEGKIKFIQLKNRFSNISYKRTELLNVDYTKMRVSDISEPIVNKPQTYSGSNISIDTPLDDGATNPITWG